MGIKTIRTVFNILAIMILAAPAVSAAFAVLRVCNIISWSWWIVTLPLWGTAAIIITLAVTLRAVTFAVKYVISHPLKK